MLEKLMREGSVTFVEGLNKDYRNKCLTEYGFDVDKMGTRYLSIEHESALNLISEPLVLGTVVFYEEDNVLRFYTGQDVGYFRADYWIACRDLLLRLLDEGLIK